MREPARSHGDIALLAELFLKTDNVWLGSLMAAGVGVYFFYRGFLTLRRKRLILNTPMSKVRSASIGLVELSGLAAGPNTLNAAVTGIPCYYYRTLAWQERGFGEDREWQKVADETMHVPFYLDDNTGRVLVDPEGAEMNLHCDLRETYNSFLSGSLECPANVATFLSRNDVPYNQKTKIEEYCLKPKNAVFVLGTLMQSPGLDVSEVPVQSVEASATNRNPLTALLSGRSNSIRTQNELPPTNRALPPAQVAMAMAKVGISRASASTAAGVAPVMVSVAATGAGPAAEAVREEFDLHPPVVLMKGAHDPAFLISWQNERDLVNKLSWQSALMIWGGPALTLISVYVLLIHLGIR